MKPDTRLRNVSDAFTAALRPPTPIQGTQPIRLLRPGRRAHQWHWVKWLGAQLSALVGLVLVLTAIDVSEWLPPELGFVSFFTRWDDMGDYIPEEWRWLWITVTLGGFLTQFMLTLMTVWLEWRTIGYLVTDQGVQLRRGLWTTHETSLRYTHVQQVVFKQDAVQRLLGLADVALSTAGQRAGGDDDDEGKTRGLLRDLEAGEARELVELVRARLPAPAAAQPSPASAGEPETALVEAAQQLTDAARALRESINERVEKWRMGSRLIGQQRRTQIARRTPRTLGGKAWDRGRRRAR